MRTSSLDYIDEEAPAGSIAFVAARLEEASIDYLHASCRYWNGIGIYPELRVVMVPGWDPFMRRDLRYDIVGVCYTEVIPEIWSLALDVVVDVRITHVRLTVIVLEFVSGSC